MKGINNSLEVFEAVEATAIAVEEAAADGFSLADLSKALEPYEAIKDAVKDVDQIDDELSDLNEEEVRELAAGCFKAVKAVLAAIEATREALAK